MQDNLSPFCCCGALYVQHVGFMHELHVWPAALFSLEVMTFSSSSPFMMERKSRSPVSRFSFYQLAKRELSDRCHARDYHVTRFSEMTIRRHDETRNTILRTFAAESVRLEISKREEAT
jgi:hypothetical protein